MITNIEQFRTTLHNLVKMDYGFEAYNWSDNSFRFSFYHLNSCYNAFAVASNYYKTEVTTEWQYATPNKRAEKYACAIALFCLTNERKREWCLKEIDYYAQKAHAIYEAKYDTQITIHSWNGSD